MTDIIDIQSVITGNIINRKYTLLFVSILLISIFVYMKFFTKTKKVVELEEVFVEDKLEAIDYKGLLLDLKEKYIDVDKDIFYAKLGSLFREYLGREVNEMFMSSTLEETEKYLSKDLFELWKRVYYPEYNTDKDSKRQRIILIKEILSVFELDNV